MRAWLLFGVVWLGASARADVAPPAASATALARTFAAEVVGKLVPVAPVAGDYAMSLTMTFEHFVTMEMRIDERRTGVLRLTLAGDGTARACLGSRGSQVTDGQYHYERDPAKRQHHASADVRLMALGGRWRVSDGVATLHFDQRSWDTCDLAKSTKSGEPAVELRCVGVAASDRVPTGSLACEASERSELLGLGMPMSEASRNTPDSPMRAAPAGRDFVLGRPGLLVEVTQGPHDAHPAITLRSGAVKLVESDYLSPK